MKLFIAAFIISFACCQAPASFVSIQNTVDCLSGYQNSFYSKVCRPSPSYNTLNCGDLSDNSFDCGGGTLGVCSDDSSVFPFRSGLTMCPQEWSGNGQTWFLYDNYEYNINSNYVQQGGVGWYKVYKYSNQYDGIRVYNLYSKNVTVSIYTSNNDRTFTTQAFTFSSGDDIKIPIGDFDPIYVIAMSDSTRIGKFQFSATLYKNPLSAGAIAGIVIGCVAFGIIFVISVVGIVKGCKKGRQKRREAKMRRQNNQKFAPNTYMPMGPNYINSPAGPIGTQIEYDKKPLLQNNQYYDGRNQININKDNRF